MKTIQIKNRFTEAVLFTTEVADDDAFPMRSALKAAIAADAYLARANLARADLAGANLAGANLAGDARPADGGAIPLLRAERTAAMVNRDHISEQEATALDSARDSASARRARNTSAGHCLNDNAQHTHATPVPGKTRCAWCVAVHRYGLATAAKRFAAIRPEAVRGARIFARVGGA